MGDRIAWLRAAVSAIVGGFLIVYAAVAAPPARIAVGVLGLVLLGVLSIDVLPIRHRRKP